jgi:hypothetical protein
MKSVLYITTAILLFTFCACTKESGKTAIVVKDCSGTYLRVDGKDYHVCNLEKTDPFADSATVTVVFKSIAECNGSAKDAVICFMLHENEGWIEVEEIKTLMKR